MKRAGIRLAKTHQDGPGETGASVPGATASEALDLAETLRVLVALGCGPAAGRGEVNEVVSVPVSREPQVVAGQRCAHRANRVARHLHVRCILTSVRRRGILGRREVRVVKTAA